MANYNNIYTSIRKAQVDLPDYTIYDHLAYAGEIFYDTITRQQAPPWLNIPAYVEGFKTNLVAQLSAASDAFPLVGKLLAAANEQELPSGATPLSADINQPYHAYAAMEFNWLNNTMTIGLNQIGRNGSSPLPTLEDTLHEYIHAAELSLARQAGIKPDASGRLIETNENIDSIIREYIQQETDAYVLIDAERIDLLKHGFNIVSSDPISHGLAEGMNIDLSTFSFADFRSNPAYKPFRDAVPPKLFAAYAPSYFAEMMNAPKYRDNPYLTARLLAG